MLKYRKTKFQYCFLSLQILLVCVSFNVCQTKKNKSPICLQFQTPPQCEYKFKNEDLTVSCPSANVAILLDEDVTIKGKKGEIQSFIKEIPEKLNIGQIRNCTSGQRDSIKNVLNQMDVSGFKVFTFNSRQSIINKQQFDNLKSVSDLLFAIKTSEALPSDLFENAPNVEELRFYPNQAQLSKGIFDSFINLKKLELDGNYQATEFPEGVFDRLKNLKTIIFHRMKNLNLPKDIFAHTTNLTFLILNGNDLKTLPSGIFDNLTNLNSLYFINNPLNDLPRDLLHKTSHLKEILMLINENGNLRTLPSQFFANKTSLLGTILSGNIEELPEDLFYGSTNIADIDICETLLKKLPENLFLDQVALTHLHLDRNELIKLPDDLFRYTVKLRELLLSHNQLTEINDSIFRSLSLLEALEIGNNKINFIANDAFRMCSKLERLQLSHNQLTTISSTTFSGLKSLSFLGLDNNNLSSIASDAFCNTKDLATLHLDHNNLNTNSTRAFLNCLHPLINLSKLDLSYNEIASITKEDLKFLSSKDLEIVLTGNRIERVDLPFTNSKTANGPTIILD